jgi:hypothetical protein
VAHEAARSQLTVTANETAAEILFSAHVADLSHELVDVDAAMLLREDLRDTHTSRLAELMMERCALAADGRPLFPYFQRVSVDSSARVWHFYFTAPWERIPDVLVVQARPFPWDSEHQVFLTVLRAGTGRHDRVLRGASRGTRVLMSALADSASPAGRADPDWRPRGRGAWFAVGLTGLGILWLRRNATGAGVPACLPS